MSNAMRFIGIATVPNALASIHRTEISQLERGLRVPRLDTIVKLRDVLGVTTDELIAGIAWHPASISRGGFVKRDRS
jgi:transcriptional regulator with XRE-family HTH domain